MKVSVVIPAYNEENYIGPCLQSLMDQEVKADEIIVVNSNSTDGTAAVIKKFPVTMLHGDFKDTIAARDHGFNHAQHEIIARFDADTRAAPDWIKRIKADFEEKTVDAVTGPSDFYDFFLGSAIYYRMYLAFMQMWLGYSVILGTNMALTKKMWETIRSETCKDVKAVHEDIDLAIHIHEHGGKILYDPHLLTHTSSRRERENPVSFFVEYPKRLAKMFRDHKKDKITSAA